MENSNDIGKMASTHTASHEKSIHQNLSSLPDELLMKIVGKLPHSDLHAMMIVNKKFNNLASDPSLWKKYPIPSMEIVHRHGYHTLLKVLEFPKFCKLERLDLVLIPPYRVNTNDENSLEVEPDQEFLKIMEMASTLPLKSLDLSLNDLLNTLENTPDQVFLANIVLNIQHVEFNNTFLMGQRASFQILNNILDGVSVTSVLRSVNLRNCDLDQLSVSSIVKLNCFSELSMEGAFLRPGKGPLD